jgi:PAS domain-containing protein
MRDKEGLPEDTTTDKRPTTIRLSQSLRERLKEQLQQANHDRESMDSFVEIAIKHELERRAFSLPTCTDWESGSAVLAQLFLECIPSPVVVKDIQQRVVWCNLAYEQLFKQTLLQLRGRTIQGLIDAYSYQRLEADLGKIMHGEKHKRGRPIEFLEPMTMIDGTNKAFRAFRFLFSPTIIGKTPTARQTRQEFIGDVSFDWAEVQVGVRHSLNPALARHITENLSEELAQLFPAFLQKCPNAIAIKKPSAELVWCNHTYLGLLDGVKSYKEIEGKTTQELFKLDVSHPIVQNDLTVARQNVWLYTIEDVPERGFRSSLRFPIPGSDGRPAFICVCSTDFQLGNITRTAFYRQARPRVKKTKTPFAPATAASSTGKSPRQR